MGNYDDIIILQHHVSKNHPRMSMYQRAAQFAPFAALVGHEAMIAETARLTDAEIDMGEEAINILNQKMSYLKEKLKERPFVTITYFLPDLKKAGGEYLTISGIIKKIDDFEQTIVMEDGTIIPLQATLDLDSEIFNFIDY